MLCCCRQPAPSQGTIFPCLKFCCWQVPRPLSLLCIQCAPICKTERKLQRNEASHRLGDLPKVAQQARVLRMKTLGQSLSCGLPLRPDPEHPHPHGHPRACPIPHGQRCALTHAVLCFSPDLPMQILKPATFTDTTHYPLLLVV